MKFIFKSLFLISTSSLLFTGCVKKEIELQKLESEVIDPSFAFPIGGATFNLGRIESHFADDFFIYNQTTGLLEYIYPKQLFNLKVADMIQFPNPSASANFGMPVGAQSTLVGGGAGTTVNFYHQSTTTFNAPNGELIDSITVKQGSLDINLSSDFMHSGSVDVVIPSLTKNGGAFNKTINFTYSGTTPVVNTASFDIAGYKLDMTDGGTTNNTSRFAFNATITSSGAGVSSSDEIRFTIDVVIDTLQSAFGYFGSYTNILSQDTLPIDFFENLYGGQVHVEEPRIEINVFNTAGIDVKTDFVGVIDPASGPTSILSGAGLNLPTILGANNPGDTAVTPHLIDNTNTSPTLTDMVDAGPSEIIYSATSETNPGAGTPSSFVTCESRVWGDSRLVLPLNGWGNNFQFRDSTDADIEGVVDVDSADIENIEAFTLRLIVDNGLPIDAFVQAYFCDTNFVIIDSLFDVAGGQNIIKKATVNFSVPVGDPNYGRVTLTGAKRKITDIVMDKTRFNNLVNNGAKKLIYVANGLTNDAPNRSVKFYPEYNLKMKLSAKVDLTYQLRP